MNWGTVHPDYYAAGMLEGMEMACPDRWQVFSREKNSAALIRRNPDFDKVAVVISGGAANGPLFPGYVAPGLADAAVLGAPFAAPNAYCLYDVSRYLGRKKGVLLLYNNFAGDYLNNDMAQELLEMEGIEVESVIATDDIASALGEARGRRCGRCGMAWLIKMAGRCTELGMSLSETAAILRAANQRLGTLSLMVDFEGNKILYGNGFSGEPGFFTATHMDMETTAAEAMDLLCKDLIPTPSERLYLLVNRLRYTSYADGFIMVKAAAGYLAQRYNVAQTRVANYSNILDAYGFNFSILCADAEMERYLGGTVYTDSFML